MKTIVYLRVSTEKQGDSGAGLSAQLNSCKACSTIDAVFQDVVSGSSGLESRPGMLNAIAQLEKGDVLLVAKRDRLGRDPLVLAMIEASVARRGASIRAADGLGNGDTPSEILMKRIVDAMSEYELQLIKARTKAALAAKKAKNERTGTIPFGKMVMSDGIHLVDNPEEQAIISMVTALRKSGLSLRAIAENLNNRNITKRKGAKWNHVNLHTILKNVNAAARSAA